MVKVWVLTLVCLVCLSVAAKEQRFKHTTPSGILNRRSKLVQKRFQTMKGLNPPSKSIVSRAPVRHKSLLDHANHSTACLTALKAFPLTVKHCLFAPGSFMQDVFLEKESKHTESDSQAQIKTFCDGKCPTDIRRELDSVLKICDNHMPVGFEESKNVEEALATLAMTCIKDPLPTGEYCLPRATPYYIIGFFDQMSLKPDKVRMAAHCPCLEKVVLAARKLGKESGLSLLSDKLDYLCLKSPSNGDFCFAEFHAKNLVYESIYNNNNYDDYTLQTAEFEQKAQQDMCTPCVKADAVIAALALPLSNDQSSQMSKLEDEMLTEECALNENGEACILKVDAAESMTLMHTECKAEVCTQACKDLGIELQAKHGCCSGSLFKYAMTEAKYHTLLKNMTTTFPEEWITWNSEDETDFYMGSLDSFDYGYGVNSQEGVGRRRRLLADPAPVAPPKATHSHPGYVAQEGNALDQQFGNLDYYGSYDYGYLDSSLWDYKEADAYTNLHQYVKKSCGINPFEVSCNEDRVIINFKLVNVHRGYFEGAGVNHTEHHELLHRLLHKDVALHVLESLHAISIVNLTFPDATHVNFTAHVLMTMNTEANIKASLDKLFAWPYTNEALPHSAKSNLFEGIRTETVTHSIVTRPPTHTRPPTAPTPKKVPTPRPTWQPATACAVGSLKCACTQGGGCDADLMCSYSICIQAKIETTPKPTSKPTSKFEICQIGSPGCECKPNGCTAGLTCIDNTCKYSTNSALDNCKILDTEVNYKLSWSKRNDDYILSMEAKCEGWIAMGLSADGTMRGGRKKTDYSDIAMGYIRSGGCENGCLNDYYSTDNVIPELDKRNDLTLISASRKDGVMKFMFSRKGDTKDARDYSMKDVASLIWACNTDSSQAPVSPMNFVQHDHHTTNTITVNFPAGTADVAGVPLANCDGSISSGMATNLQNLTSHVYSAAPQALNLQSCLPALFFVSSFAVYQLF